MDVPTTSALHATLSYAITHGLVTPLHDENATPGTDLVHTPITYSPSLFPVSAFEHAKLITTALNGALYRIASDHEFLQSRLIETADADSCFTGKLLKMLQEVEKSPVPQSQVIDLSITRYDYFAQIIDGKPGLRMVEMNTMAAGGASMGTKTAELHRYVAMHPATRLDIDPMRLPPTNPLAEVARGIAVAHKQYIKLHNLHPAPRFSNALSSLPAADGNGGKSKPSPPCAPMIIAQPASTSFYDQDHHRHVLWKDHHIDMVRMSFRDVYERGSIDEDGHLRVTPKGEGSKYIITVVYFREGYLPSHFPTDMEWNARLTIEKSLAAKCPSLAMQLVGLKKMQQVIYEHGVIERFVENKKDAQEIRSTFAKQYSLSLSENGEAAYRMAIENPSNFVLKPQRENGGNNFFDADIPRILNKCTPTERAAYVLMEKISPITCQNVFLRHGKAVPGEVASELNVFGIQVCVGGKEVANWEAGTTMRSKMSVSKEGGVLAGYGVYDSPLLY